jgi:putative ABC transport system permease protein
VKALEQQLKQAVADVDNREPVEHLRTMEEIVDSTKASSRFDAWLFGGFAGLALLLTAVGLYGLLSFSVARRTSEIGTRLALGAGRSKVIELILWQGMRLVAVGLFLGLAGAVLLTRSLSSLLFGVRVTDPASYCAVALIMLAVSLLASYFPARRAASLDPMMALRSE